MKGAHEIAFGFVIFFIIDRISRLISASFAHRRNLTELETERLRCSIELTVLSLAFVILLKR
jgi:hypothetical protein